MPKNESKPTSDKEQTQVPPTYLFTPPPYPQQFEDDTIDLYELWNTLWNKKWLIAAMTILVTFGSVVYALRLPLIYKAQAFLLPPKAIDVQSLNAESVQSVYATFKKNLSSRRLKMKFIKDLGLMDILAPGRTPETRDIEILESFSTMIKVENLDIYDYAQGEGILVSTKSKDPEFAAKIVNDYIKFMDIETVRGLSAAALNSIAVKIRDIEYNIGSKTQMEKVRREDQIRDIENNIFNQREKAKKHRMDDIKKLENLIKSKRAMAKIQREDKIKLYEEAAIIAFNLGFKDIVETTNIVQNTQNSQNSQMESSSTPLYYRGFRALNAEIEYLKNRKSDDPFISDLRGMQDELDKLRNRESDDPYIFGLRELQVKVDRLLSKKSDYTIFPGLRSLQEELALLRSIKIDEEGQHAVTIDQAAYPPKYPIARNRKMIVTLGAVAGLFLGIFLAFFVSFLQKQKKIHSA